MHVHATPDRRDLPSASVHRASIVAAACTLALATAALAQPCTPALRTFNVSNNPAGQSSTANSIAAIGARAAIQVNQTARAFTWTGLTGETAPLINSANPSLQFLTPNWFVGTFGSKFYFTASTRLYNCNLDGSEPTALFGPASSPQFPITISPSESFQLAPIGNQLLFACFASGSGTELAITDGTSDGTRILLDINPGSASSDPQRLLPFGSSVFFYARTASTGLEPWVTDGTVAGTVMLADTAPGTAGVDGANRLGATAVRFGADVYFLARRPGTVNNNLFRTNGTPAGTSQVDLGGIEVRGHLTAIDAGLLFVGFTSATSDALFITDGTLAGTRLVFDVPPDPSRSDYDFVRSAGDRAFFSANTTAGGFPYLFVTDGSLAGTTQIPIELSGGRTPVRILAGPVIRNKFVFAAIGAPNSRLAITDGTPAGTCAIPGNFTSFFEYADRRGLVHAATPSRAFVMGIDTPFGNEPRVIDLCPPDFNNSGAAPDAQDIFDFLTAFFTSSPAADFNNSGNAPTIQDVFDFITAWFNGCA